MAAVVSPIERTSNGGNVMILTAEDDMGPVLKPLWTELVRFQTGRATIGYLCALLQTFNHYLLLQLDCPLLRKYSHEISVDVTTFIWPPSSLAAPFPPLFAVVDCSACFWALTSAITLCHNRLKYQNRMPY
jgi:hypothetical protein